MHDDLTDVPGLLVGHETDREHATGCTVVLCPQGAVGGVDVRGSAPGTRETDLLRPGRLVPAVHAVVLSGGSAFGLDTACGVMRWLEEQGVGFSIAGVRVPIVAGAILFDLNLVTGRVRPDAEWGYRACQRAHAGPVEQGSVGAGTGATVAKMLGMERAVKAGIGSASLDLGEGVVVGALVAVNALGDVVDPWTGRLLAGPRREEGGFYTTTDLLVRGQGDPPPPLANTTIGVVATNARLTREEANRLASQAHDGLALAVRPAHLMGDGDTFFALATGEAEARVRMDRLLSAVMTVVARAVVRAVVRATGLGGVPALRDLQG